jgi:hypothetical protein
MVDAMMCSWDFTRVSLNGCLFALLGIELMDLIRSWKGEWSRQCFGGCDDRVNWSRRTILCW